MGKILICTKQQDFVDLKKMFESFEQSNENNAEGLFVSTYSKLRIRTSNGFSNGNGFIYGVGTFCYNGKKDNDALTKIFEDFNDVRTIRNKIIGSYCIIIKKRNKCFVFVDPLGSYDVFYYHDKTNGRFILTNTIFHIGKIVKNLQMNESDYISYWVKTQIGKKTFIKDIFKLCGDEYLSFDNNGVLRNKITIQYDDIDNVANYLKEKYESIPTLFSKPGILLTGGQDSRMSLALSLSLGMKPIAYYGIGNSSDTCTKKADFDIVKEICKKNQLLFQTMNWNNSPQDKIDYYLNKYGELFTLYCFNTNIINEFEKLLDCDLLIAGYFGEEFRNIEPIQNYKKNIFSLHDFLNDIYLSGKKRLFKKNYTNYYNDIYECFLQVCVDKHIDPEKMRKQDFQKLNSIYRQRWDVTINNFINQFFYSFPLFGDCSVINHIENVSYDEKDNSKYQMGIIKDLFPPLLHIKFFSHIKEKELNIETLELTETRNVSKQKDFIRSLIKSELIKHHLRNIYYKIVGDEKGLQENIRQHSEKKELRYKLQNCWPLTILNLKKVISELDSNYLKQLYFQNYIWNRIRTKGDSN